MLCILSRNIPYISPNPTVVSYYYGPAKFNVGSAGGNFGFVGCRKDRDIRAKHAPISYCDERAVENSQIEVCIEAFAQGDVAAVIYIEGWFDDWPIVRTKACGPDFKRSLSIGVTYISHRQQYDR